MLAELIKQTEDPKKTSGNATSVCPNKGQSTNPKLRGYKPRRSQNPTDRTDRQKPIAHLDRRPLGQWPAGQRIRYGL